MSFFGIRRGRNGRGATLRLAAGPSADWRDLFTDRTKLARIALAFLTIGGLTLCVQAWKHSFPFRLGQRPADGVAAIIDFQRINRELTARARDRAAEQVPPIFRHDPRPLSRAPQDLRAGILAFGPVRDVSSLPPEIRRDFGLTIEGNQNATSGLPAGDRVEAFERIKQIATSEEKLRDVTADFGKFIQPLEKNGILLRPEQAPGELIGSGELAVADTDGQSRIVNLTDVQLQPLLAPTGLLYGRWALFPTLLPIRSELEAWMKVRLPETLSYDNKVTQDARLKASVGAEEVPDQYNAGNLLVKPGELIDEAKLELLATEYEQIDAQMSVPARLTRVAVVFSMFLVLAVLIGYYLVHNERGLVWDIRRLSLYLLMFVLSVALARGLSYDPWRAEIGPLLVCVMVCAVVYNQMLATLTAFALSLIVAVSTGADIGRFTVMMTVCAVAAILLRSVSSRSTLVVVGLWTAVAYFLMKWGTSLVENYGVVPLDQPWAAPLWRDLAQWVASLRGAGWCLAAGFLVSGSLPFIEATFGAVTDISLLELGDVSHPLLQELVRRAPGTYNHSITVASIGETAADAIGANGLLVRVGA